MICSNIIPAAERQSNLFYFQDIERRAGVYKCVSQKLPAIRFISFENPGGNNVVLFVTPDLIMAATREWLNAQFYDTGESVSLVIGSKTP